MIQKGYLCNVFNLRYEFDAARCHFATHKNEREVVEEEVEVLHVFTESIHIGNLKEADVRSFF